MVEGSHLLVAAGRQANIEGLNLESVGIEHDAKGVRKDDSLRTTNRKVWAVGDVAGRWQFTHVASYHATGGFLFGSPRGTLLVVIGATTGATLAGGGHQGAVGLRAGAPAAQGGARPRPARLLPALRK